MFIDEYSDFYPDVADALSNSSEQMSKTDGQFMNTEILTLILLMLYQIQVSKTGRQDSVKIADSFYTHFDALNSQPSIQ